MHFLDTNCLFLIQSIANKWKNMTSVKLYLDRRAPRKDGKYPLKLVVTHKQPFIINLKIYLKEEQWGKSNYNSPQAKKLYGQIIEQ